MAHPSPSYWLLGITLSEIIMSSITAERDWDHKSETEITHTHTKRTGLIIWHAQILIKKQSRVQELCLDQGNTLWMKVNLCHSAFAPHQYLSVVENLCRAQRTRGKPHFTICMSSRWCTQRGKLLFGAGIIKDLGGVILCPWPAGPITPADPLICARNATSKWDTAALVQLHYFSIMQLAAINWNIKLYRADWPNYI